MVLPFILQLKGSRGPKIFHLNIKGSVRETYTPQPTIATV